MDFSILGGLIIAGFVVVIFYLSDINKKIDLIYRKVFEEETKAAISKKFEKLERHGK